MIKIGGKSFEKMTEKDLANKVQEARSELAKLRVDGSKGTLRKKSGKLKPLRHNIARMLTRINQLQRQAVTAAAAAAEETK